MTGVLCAIAGSGSAGYTGSATVTVGFYASTNNNYGYIGVLGSPPGSITPATWASSGLPFFFLYWSSGNFIDFTVTGFAPNSGWDTLNIAGTNYSRSAATYTYDGTRTQWVWTGVATNPFGTITGATKAATWS